MCRIEWNPTATDFRTPEPVKIERGQPLSQQLAAADRWLEGDAILRSTVAKAERLLAAANAEESIYS